MGAWLFAGLLFLIFFGCGDEAFLQGVFAKSGVFLMVFCGEVVVSCGELWCFGWCVFQC
jgi:hypothetical protein